MKSMQKVVGLAALCALAGFSTAALADAAETKGGITVKTDDGRFEAKVGGRIHFDAYEMQNDTGALFGSGLTGVAAEIPAQGGTAFRRAYLTLTGKMYGWRYKFENDFANGASPGSFREMWIATDVGPGEVTIGQFKPYRGMEELTSSNELTMAERPWTTATGAYHNRQFLMGLGYKAYLADMLTIGVDGMQLGGANTTNEGYTYGGRVAFYPLSADGATVHVALAYSEDKLQKARNASPASVKVDAEAPYAGRRGPILNFGAVGSAAGYAGDDTQRSIAAELAGSVGPVTLQSEYVKSVLGATHIDNGNVADSDVDFYYLMASVFVTGERTTYKKDRAAFGKPKSPLNSFGAIELTARYDVGKNKDSNASHGICTITTGVAAAGVDKCEVHTITAGVNWYVNPNIRFMLNYYMGEADLGTAGKDKPKAATLRTQLSF